MAQAPSPGTPKRRIVWMLAVAETVVWAAMFYLFPALLVEWESDLGWSKAELSGAFTGALIVSAVMAPVAGRLIDRGHGRWVLTGSALLGAAMLLALSQVTALWQFYVVWLCLGLAMAGALYEACFAFVTHVFGADAKRAITLITLIAGLAGTVSFPGAHALIPFVGWRGATIAFAVLVIVVGVPLLWLASRDAGKAEIDAPTASTSSSVLSWALVSPVFWLLGLAFAMIALGHSVIMTHLLPLLAERGVHPEAAVLAASMIGPMQVAGRLAMMAIERHASITLIFAMAYVFMILAGLSLFGAAAVPVLVSAFVLFHGSGYGVTSITRPVAVAEFLGRQNFGQISGLLAIPYMGLFAAGPIIAALIWEVGGYDLVIIAAIIAAVLGLASILLAALLAGRKQPSE